MTTCLVTSLLVACSGDPLSREEVTSIPAGTGTGTAASGTWEGTLTTTSCTGSCLVKGYISLCDVGDIDDYSFELVQTDGVLTIEADGLVTPSMRGGIDANGAFRVGGYATKLGGNVELLSETVGQVDGDSFSGSAIATARGHYEDEEIECDAEFTTHGEREP